MHCVLSFPRTSQANVVSVLFRAPARSLQSFISCSILVLLHFFLSGFILGIGDMVIKVDIAFEVNMCLSKYSYCRLHAISPVVHNIDLAIPVDVLMFIWKTYDIL